MVNLGQDVHGFPYAVRKTLHMMVAEFKTEIEVARCWTCSEALPVATVVFDPRTVREARDGQRNVKAQVQTSPGSAGGPWGAPPSGIPPGVYYADLTLGGRAITVKLLVQEREDSTATHVRYLYTTDLSLSGEEACLAGDRGTPRDVKALGLPILEEGEPSGLPHDLHRDQRRQLIGELNLGSVDAFLMF